LREKLFSHTLVNNTAQEIIVEPFLDVLRFGHEGYM